jgi:surface protein
MKFIVFLILLALLMPLVNADLDDGLVLYYKLDQIGPDRLIMDYSGNENHGLANVHVTCEETGIHGNACLFNGSADISAPINLSTGYSVTSWVKLNSLNDMDIWGDEWNYRGGGLQLFQGEFATIMSNGGFFRQKTGFVPELNIWYYVTQVFKGNSVETYINGNLIANNVFPIILARGVSGYYRLGKASFGSLHLDRYRGYLDDYRVYNRALTQSEIIMLKDYHFVRYFPEGLTDVGECQRGIEKWNPSLQDWEVLREPVFPSQELCGTNRDEDCDGIIDNVDTCVGIVELSVGQQTIFVGENNNVNVSFRGLGENVVCNDSLSGQVIERVVGSNVEEFVFELNNLDEGLQQGAVECSFGDYSFSKSYYFEVESRGDVGVKALEVDNSNPAVGDIVKARIIVENYSDVTFNDVELDLEVRDDLFGAKNVVLTRSNVVQELGPREIKVVEVEFSYSGTGWIELNAIIDKDEKLVFDSRNNKQANRIIYVGLPDPNIVSGGIVLNAQVSPSERPQYGLGFNVSGRGEYLVNGNLRLDTAGALIEAFVSGPENGYFYSHTNNNGSFNVYLQNPGVVGDYNATIRITDGTYEAFVYLFFSVVEQEVCTVNCYVPCTNCGSGGSGSGGSGGGWGGSSGGGWGGSSGGGSGGGTYPGCIGPDLFGRIEFDPSPPFVREDNVVFETMFYLGGRTGFVYPDFNVHFFKNGLLVEELRIEGFVGGWLEVYDRNDLAVTSDVFKMVIDPYNEVVECSKANNVVVARTVVEPRFNDISIDDIIIPVRTLQQESNVFRVKVSNLGNVVARDVNISFDNGEGVVETKLIDSIGKGTTIFVNFNVQFGSVGKKVLTAFTDYVDDNPLNNSFSREFVVFSHDFFITSVDQGGRINLIFSNENPDVGEVVNVDALYRCDNPLMRGVVPVSLFVNGVLSETKDFDFDCSVDNIARFDFTPRESQVYIMGVYVNYTMRVYEQNLENNYATRALIVDDPRSFIVNRSQTSVGFDFDIVLERKVGVDWVGVENVVSKTSVFLDFGESFILTNLFNDLVLVVNESGDYRLALNVFKDGFRTSNYYSAIFSVVGDVEFGVVECLDINVRDSVVVDGVSYLVVDDSTIRSAVSAGEIVCTSHVNDMIGLFKDASNINQDLSRWDVSNVTNMRQMFNGASRFNQDIGGWDVSGVTNMSSMFSGALGFNQDLSGWDASSVVHMRSMFSGARSFDQDLSGWCVEKISSKPSNFDDSADSWVLPRPNWGQSCS